MRTRADALDDITFNRAIHFADKAYDLVEAHFAHAATPKEAQKLAQQAWAAAFAAKLRD